MNTFINFKPKQVSKRLLAVLPERSRAIIMSRYGLEDSSEPMTLESIGECYGITRERVRQIENHSLEAIRKSDHFKKEEAAFKQLEDAILSLGCVVCEDDLLETLSKASDTKNHIHLFLVLGDVFIRADEDEHFKDRWHVDSSIAEKVHQALKNLHKDISEKDLIPESEMISRFAEHLKGVDEQYKQDEILKRWLAISKTLGRNPLGEWGNANSSSVKAKSIRDLAYLAIRKHGSPMHFAEVAKVISEVFNRRAHVATCHNELIKDKRFVLVGRGLYALSEWGYMSGVVRDVIKEILKKNGPLTKDQVVEKVLKERYVKPNTIIVNLQSSGFKRDKDGRYALI